MSVTADEIAAATKDPSSPVSAGDEMPGAAEGNGAATSGP
jgi:hypothetical protein